MLKFSELDDDQLNLIDRLYEHDTTLVYATMGSGKTVCTLTSISELIRDGVLNRVLIVAPLKPCKEVWAGEHLEWEHLTGLRVGMATGTPIKRLAALQDKSFDVVVINMENLAWFCDTFKRNHCFDGVVMDELSKFKDSSAKLVKKFRYVTDSFKWHVGLTGSPVHESFTGLFGQMLVMDGGKIYGRNKEKFLQQYFYPTDYEQRNWEVRDNMRAPLINALRPVWYTMPDYTHTLPPVIEKKISVGITEAIRDIYKSFKRNSVLELDGMEPIVAENAAVLSGKLEQVTSGFVYDGDDVIRLAKSDRLRMFLPLIGSSALKGKNRLIFYTFDEERRQILDALGALGEDFLELGDKDSVTRWNSGEVRNFVLHPKSAGHGLNLAKGGHIIIWYSPIWSNDVTKQAIARLWRRGQKEAVTSYTLVCLNTIDELKMQSVEDKDEHDRLLREHFAS